MVFWVYVFTAGIDPNLDRGLGCSYSLTYECKLVTKDLQYVNIRPCSVLGVEQVLWARSTSGPRVNNNVDMDATVSGSYHLRGMSITSQDKP